MSFTLLHTADLHLGKSFSSLPPERAEQRRADLLSTLRRICRHAREGRVQLLCIAGDLFDRAAPAAPLCASARQALAAAEVPVLLVPGNHDPLEEGSPYLANQWPGNVRVANKPGWQRVELDGPETWAFGYTRGEAHRSPWQNFPGCSDEAVLVLHAACLGQVLASEAGYFPFSPPDIPACAYLALGHHHRPAQVNRSPLAWYAGSPEPLEAEAVAPAVLSVTLKSTVEVEPLDLTTRHHRLVSLDVTNLTAEEIWDRALAVVSTDDLLTLQVHGMLEPDEPLDLSRLRDELNTRCFAAEVAADALLLPPDLSTATGVKGALLEITRERMAEDDSERPRLERALRYALLALEGKL
ncbi:MAG TPA: DNA repair exonuclease [Armatimonadota bacterium]|jgi:DNA repair exonuclease SbcCD nuclease subunit